MSRGQLKTTHCAESPARGSNRRAEILAAARDVFFEGGYQKASMREIAAKAGLTQAALYYHFDNKEDLLVTLLEAFSEELLQAIMAELAGGGDAKARLEAIVRRQIGFIRVRRKDLKILVEDKQHVSSEKLGVIRTKEQMIYRLYRSCLEDLARNGLVRNVDTTTATFTILGAINWIMHWYREDGRRDLDRIADDIVNIVFNGLFVPPVPEARGGASA